MLPASLGSAAPPDAVKVHPAGSAAHAASVLKQSRRLTRPDIPTLELQQETEVPALSFAWMRVRPDRWRA